MNKMWNMVPVQIISWQQLKAGMHALTAPFLFAYELLMLVSLPMCYPEVIFWGEACLNFRIYNARELVNQLYEIDIYRM